MSGCVHVYTGNGKGKTTAALGLALRAAGAGLNVYIAQFAKGMYYSELTSIARLSDRITLRQFGRDCFICKAPEQGDIDAAIEGLDQLREVISSGKYQVVILDEANIATYFSLFTVDDLLGLIDSKPDRVELVITGRYADPRVMNRADLVTEMLEVKHYYNEGIQARIGIEK
ncbi:MAG: cob(I)yrinic acid a,c-diamide adenosyltransferase [Armatimonadota bacterium]|nr:cob(I)yrinic acid a,c-diamide adenosyltransferase [bacterium]